MILYHSILLFMAIAAALLAFGLSFVRRALSRRDLQPESLRAYTVLEFGYRGCQGFACFFASLALLPMNIGLVFSLALTSMWVYAIVLYRREAAATLCEAIQTVCRTQGSLAALTRDFGWGDATLLGARCRAFAAGLERGADPVPLARWMRLPLDMETLLFLQHRHQAAWKSPRAAVAGQPTLSIGSQASGWPAGTQLAYLLGILLSSGLVIVFVSQFVMPSIQEMLLEFEIELASWQERWFSAFQWVPPVLVLVVVLWGGLAFLFWITDWNHLLMLLPISGPLIHARRRAACLRGVAAAIDAGCESSQALQLTSAATTNRGQQVRLTKALAIAQRGATLGDALCRSGIAPGPTAAWIESAVQTGRVADTLRTLADDLLRRSQLRADTVMAVLFPVGILLCGAFVLSFSYLLLHALTALIHGLA